MAPRIKLSIQLQTAFLPNRREETPYNEHKASLFKVRPARRKKDDGLMRRLLLLLLVLSLALPLIAWAAPSSSPPAQTCGPNVVHIVQRGENVFRISLRYGTTVRAIATANALANPNRIYPGQRLLVPCPSGVVLPPATTPTPVPVYVTIPNTHPILVTLPSGGWAITPELAGPVNCLNFRPTSPTDGLSRGSTTFYWDAAQGVQSYTVNLYNFDSAGGRIVATYSSNGPQTRLTGDTGVGAIGEGFRFAWSVQAWVDGRMVCATRPVNLLRSAQ
jgi:LysM repeat protein